MTTVRLYIVKENEMYTQEQLTQEMASLAAATPLTAQDIRNARAAMLDARDQLEAAERAVQTANMQYSYMPAALRSTQLVGLYDALDAARQKKLETEQDYKTKHGAGAHLEAIEAEQTRLTSLRQQEQERMAAAAVASEKETQAFFRERYINAGGTAEGFTAAWPSMWASELERRTLAGRDLETEKLLRTGRYARI